MAEKKGIVSLPSSGGEAGLNRYLSEIKKFPILSPEEEFMLAKRWREHNDTEAAAKLVNSPLRLAGQDCQGVPRLRPPSQRADQRRQYRPDAGREEVRAGPRLPPRNLCHVVDSRL